MSSEERTGAAGGWLTVNEVCARLKVSRMTLHRWCRDGYLPKPVRPTGAGRGRIARWLPQDVEDFERRLAADRR